MTLANVPNKVLTCNAFKASIPQAVDHDVSAQFPDTMYIPKVFRNILACSRNTARLGVILSGPLTIHCLQA